MPFEKNAAGNSGSSAVAGLEILGPGARAQESLRGPPSASPGAPPAPQGLTCIITLWLAFQWPPRPSSHTKRVRKKRESSPRAQPPAPNELYRLSRGAADQAADQAPGPARPGLRSAPGAVFTAGRSPLRGAACPLRAPSVPPRPRTSFSRAAPSAAPAPLPAGELFSWLPPPTSAD